MKNLNGALRDPLVRATALRLTLAAMIAMVVATGFGLQNPWWAAMATWMIGQPPRGLMLERSVAQFVGTLLGAATGVAIALAGNPYLELTCLALWLAFCCGLANAMRHQRAYGAALAGLTASVVVTLTTGTEIAPLSFAGARVADTLIGIGASLAVGFLLQPRARAQSLSARSATVLAEGLRLVGMALQEHQTDLVAREAAFLSALAAISAGAEDAAAGSFKARRRLRPLNTMSASLLDLIVVARMIRKASESRSITEQADLPALRAALERAADVLEETGELAPLPALGVIERTAAAHAELKAILGTFAAGLREVAQSHRALADPSLIVSTARMRPQPDLTGLKRAVARGFLAIATPAVVWTLTGWEAGRFLVLGASIFTVLFATLDQPLPLVRQGLIGGAVAALAAVAWRLGIVPFAELSWLSLLLALPLFCVASLLQASRATVFAGLTFNMFFAVMARPVDMLPSSPQTVVASAAMLIVGVVISDFFYRWVLPMDVDRRRGHIEASIRREIAFVSLRAGTPLAERHLSRLRHLVVEMVTRARADTAVIGDAVAALSLGHIAMRLGQIVHREPPAVDGGDIAQDCLRRLANPIADPAACGRELLESGRAIVPENMTSAVRLAHLMARELIDHPRIFKGGTAR
ncbi:FUSC family protein [Xinfangfangia sp. D13-10-4-6]|uniref:FUSC family protein n=1 Tax=Pseudogemmobacter hezensis TaxID=2737662 RepID=UPI0015516AF6|nr:FUSC family protein [Pseudogemmobacter hezensis]NPD14980.1 FUSC family protein [Pseudogemmobacter hezensis]